MIPPQLAERARRARVILEVGAGGDFRTARALAQAAPHARVVVSDVDPRVLLAPADLHGILLDVTRPDAHELPDADLAVAVRLPEELQLSAAKLARRLGADLAIRVLKDEWVDVSEAFRKYETWPDGWRYHPFL